MVFICLGIYVSSLFCHYFHLIVYEFLCGGGVGIQEENSRKESMIKLRTEVFSWNDIYGSE